MQPINMNCVFGTLEYWSLTADSFLSRDHMLNTYGVLAAASISMILHGLIKHKKDTRANTSIWKFLDGGAEAMSLTLAGSLLSVSDRTGNAIGLLLVLASLGIGYCHYQKLTNSRPERNYVDGANLALWSTVLLGQLGL